MRGMGYLTEILLLRKKMNIYGTYRMAYTNSGNRYSISYYLDNELADYKAAGVMSIEDMTISDNQYTRELAP